MFTGASKMKRIYLDHVTELTSDQFHEQRKRIGLEHTRFFVNRLPDTIYIRDRAGLLTALPPRLESEVFEPDRFYIAEQYECSPEIRSEYIRQSRNTPNSMRQHTHKALLENWTVRPPVAKKFSTHVLSSVDLPTLMEHDGVLYLEDHDLVVMYGMTQQNMERIHHPYSKAGYTYNSFRRLCENNPYLRSGDFTLNIRIVDNHDTFGSRWVLLNDVPHCVVACKDEEVTDGIYVTCSKTTLNGAGPQKLLSDRFEFGDKKLPYKLYESQQEALQDRSSNQLKELEAKALAAETGLLKARQERDNLEREAEQRQQKHAQDMEKLRNEHQKLIKEQELYMHKHVGDVLSVGRKNTIELIKCVPVILSSIAALVAVVRNK